MPSRTAGIDQRQLPAGDAPHERDRPAGHHDHRVADERSMRESRMPGEERAGGPAHRRTDREQQPGERDVGRARVVHEERGAHEPEQDAHRDAARQPVAPGEPIPERDPQGHQREDQGDRPRRDRPLREDDRAVAERDQDPCPRGAPPTTAAGRSGRPRRLAAGWRRRTGRRRRSRSGCRRRSRAAGSRSSRGSPGTSSPRSRRRCRGRARSATWGRRLDAERAAGAGSGIRTGYGRARDGPVGRVR